jgi:DNA/RNA-binding domain of Phe-tRNA-synthetase-like protein
MKFIIDKKVFEKLKDYCAGVIVASGIDNTKASDDIAQMLKKQVQKAQNELKDVNLKEHESITVYREAMQTVGINPNRFPCSIEAMLKRVQKGSGLPSLNAIVDLNNYISVKYKLPMGSHDIDALSGDIQVRYSKQGDLFLPLGQSEEEILDAGELVYADDVRIRTRKWIYRQSDIGKISPESETVFFPIDGFHNVNKGKVDEAASELAALLKDYFNCEVLTGFVDKDKNEMVIK